MFGVTVPIDHGTLYILTHQNTSRIKPIKDHIMVAITAQQALLGGKGD